MSKEKFSEMQQLFRRMSNEICVVVESYYIWRALTFARSIPEVGQERADKNAQLMSLYKDFFIPTEHSHLQVFIVGLMKFFDKNPSALSIRGLICQIQYSKEDLTVEDLKNAHPHLEEMDAVPQNYFPIKNETISFVDEIFEKHRELIPKLKDIRDKEFAHVDIKPHRGTFIPNEVEDLIKDVQEIFNRISNDFELSTTAFSFVKEGSINSTRFLLENLERGEIQRQEEFKKKYGS
jgi:hypothetical protein